jgi:two-component system chemotaxis response regulator CheY
MKALVVDDELTTRMVVQEILSTYGEVHSCVDGSEAVLAYRRSLDRGEPYDLICMDLMMPTMNGIDALKLIRMHEEAGGRLRTRTKVIITTATDDTGAIRQAFHKLCDAYIVKPIDAEELIDLVHCLFPISELGG